MYFQISISKCPLYIQDLLKIYDNVKSDETRGFREP